MGVMKSSRRRWGQTVAKTSDSWDEVDSSEPAASNSKKPSLGHAEEEKSPKEHHSQWVLCRMTWALHIYSSSEQHYVFIVAEQSSQTLPVF